MRNKNAQNNGKDGEYGEGKNEKEKITGIIFGSNGNGINGWLRIFWL